ncbi:Crp/Fnr family transcriptional regulator [Roseateles violae]|uniref:Cyclic nucleotide-binding domain-containing protein n=1 Tax=Roseateles violae TaxID=3058042 RepID=A0ABT8DY06_9BURK|nr:cyclic nucleotide-binding domain-containing protein [Pelomonas sp. PFR6]MDN3922414.1 cyclic nucleotide-binding domain-containing protein [Pelomonas sp. PFR6]
MTEIFGYLGALLTLATFSMKTMLRLRIAGIAANFAFISYGALGHVYPVLLLHLTLLPLNIWRLRQLLRLTSELRGASIQGVPASLEWLQPFSHRRLMRAGETLFRLGDEGKEMVFVLDGRFRAVEADVPLGKGEFIGELGLVSPSHRRTQTVVCDEDGTLLLISYDEVRQLYFQNPRFGFFFLELVAQRLFHDVEQRAARQAAQA